MSVVWEQQLALKKINDFSIFITSPKPKFTLSRRRFSPIKSSSNKSSNQANPAFKFFFLRPAVYLCSTSLCQPIAIGSLVRHTTMELLLQDILSVSKFHKSRPQFSPIKSFLIKTATSETPRYNATLILIH